MARILIADDEVSLRKVLAASLRREGHEVVSAQDGEEALQLLEASRDAEAQVAMLNKLETEFAEIRAGIEEVMA